MLENAVLAARKPEELREYGLKWFVDFVVWLIAWFQEGLLYALDTFGGGPTAGGTIFDTPLPGGGGWGGSTSLVDLLLGKPPSSSNWSTIHEAVTPGTDAEMLVVGIVVLFVAVQIQHVTRIFNYSNVYREKRTKRSAYAAFMFILLWYYVGVFVLFFVDGLTTGLAPNYEFIHKGLGGSPSLKSWVTISVDATVGSGGGDIVRDPSGASGEPLVHYPIFALPTYMIGALSGWAVQAIFTVRWVLIYIYMYTMPLGIALWFGNIPYVSAIAERFSKHFVTWALLPLPVALAIRGYKLIYDSSLGFGQTGKFLLGIAFPVLLLLVTVKTFQYAKPTRDVVSSTVKETASDVNAYFQGTGAADAVVRRNAEEESVGVDQSVGRRNDNSS